MPKYAARHTQNSDSEIEFEKYRRVWGIEPATSCAGVQMLTNLVIGRLGNLIIGRLGSRFLGSSRPAYFTYFFLTRNVQHLQLI